MHFHPDCNASIRGAGATRRPADEFTAASREASPARRTAEISQRVRDGYYASPAAVDQLARRLLEKGEVP